MTEIRWLYVTAKDELEAEKIGRALVERKLVACANVIPKMKSIYRWKGKIEEANESVLILKTAAKNIDTTIECIRALHSYECPCIIALPVDRGHEDYMRWILGEIE